MCHDPSLSTQEPVGKTFSTHSTSQEIAPAARFEIYPCHSMAVWVSEIGNHVSDQIEKGEKIKKWVLSIDPESAEGFTQKAQIGHWKTSYPGA